MPDDFQLRRDEEQRMQAEGRLPPGQSLTLKFPVLHYGPVPAIDPAAWSLAVFGEVEQEMRWTWDEFRQIPTAEVHTDIHCVTGWSKFDTVWEGPPARFHRCSASSRLPRHRSRRARLHDQHAPEDMLMTT